MRKISEKDQRIKNSSSSTGNGLFHELVAQTCAYNSRTMRLTPSSIPTRLRTGAFGFHADSTAVLTIPLTLQTLLVFRLQAVSLGNPYPEPVAYCKLATHLQQG